VIPLQQAIKGVNQAKNELRDKLVKKYGKKIVRLEVKDLNGSATIVVFVRQGEQAQIGNHYLGWPVKVEKISVINK
jgi:hypothetical protein